MSREQRTGQPSLHVGADLTVHVTAPDGRTAQLGVQDDGQTLRVVLARAADLGVVRASLPGGLAGVAGQLVRTARRGGLGLPPWDQHLELVVGERTVLRRRAGRWTPGPRLTTPAVGALVAAVVLVAAAVAAARRVGRR